MSDLLPVTSESVRRAQDAARAERRAVFLATGVRIADDGAIVPEGGEVRRQPLDLADGGLDLVEAGRRLGGAISRVWGGGRR